MHKKFWTILVVLLVTALFSAACGAPAPPAEPAAEEAQEAEAPAAAEEAAEEAEAAEESAAASDPASGSYYERALAGEFDGTVVTIFGPFADQDEVKFLNSIADFEEQSGIDIQYSPTNTFDTAISVRVDADDKPDIANFPQPGLMGRFVADGHIIDVNGFLEEEYLQGQYDQSWLDMATLPGPDGEPVMAGVWQRINAKSLVWYPKDDFEAAGYEVPETWEEMLALSDLIVDDGDTPWCVGIGSGPATGWPATDWLEETMLRTTSLENYDKWTQGELTFDSPEVRVAFEKMNEIFLNDDYILGGADSIVATQFGDAPVPMFEDPPRCWLHKQGNFITAFFPEGAEAKVDYDFFYLPPIDEAYGRPVLVGGDIMAMMQDRDEVRAVMEFFTRGVSLQGWLQSGGALSPHKDAQLDWYGDETERSTAEILQQATAFRYDGSDLMPGEVGAGSFWKGMTDFYSGAVDVDTALQEIDAGWP